MRLFTMNRLTRLNSIVLWWITVDKGQHWTRKITPMLYSDPDFTSCWRWHNCCELGRSISCLLHTLHNPNIIGNFSVSKRVGPEILAEACVLMHIEKSLKIKPLTSRSHKQLFGKWPEFVESSNIYAGPCCKMSMYLLWFASWRCQTPQENSSSIFGGIHILFPFVSYPSIFK